MISPTPLWQFIAGQIIGGSLRGVLCGSMIILMILPLKTGLCFNGWSFFIYVSEWSRILYDWCCCIFFMQNHADVPRFSNYVIMPMSYLCNTFSLPRICQMESDSWSVTFHYHRQSAALRQIANHEAFLFRNSNSDSVHLVKLFRRSVLVLI